MEIKTLNFTMDTKSPLYVQIYQKIKYDIAHGYLNKNDRLPSIRNLAKSLGISRTTVESAYQTLCLEGYVISIANRGYFIQMERADVIFRENILKQKYSKPEEKVQYDFSSDSIDPLCFDLPLWKRYIKESLEDNNSIYSYGDPQGEFLLRNALQRYTYNLRGVLCRYEQIIIGSSFQSLLQLFCNLLKKQQVVAMEASGFAMAEQVFKDHNYKIYKIPVLKEGLSFEELNEVSPTILYLNSAAIGSSKKPLPLSQRKKLLEWARKKKVYILEDDHNGELRYTSKSMPALQGIDTNNRVIYIGSFSKLLLPSLRIGYMVLPASLLSLYYKCKYNYSPTASKIEQMALAHYILDGHLEKQIRKSKRRYEYKSKKMLSICKEIFPSWKIQLEETALRFRLQVPHPHKLIPLLEKANSKHIRLQKDHNDLLLSFTSIPIEDLFHVLVYIKKLYNEII